MISELILCRDNPPPFISYTFVELWQRTKRQDGLILSVGTLELDYLTRFLVSSLLDGMALGKSFDLSVPQFHL